MAGDNNTVKIAITRAVMLAFGLFWSWIVLFRLVFITVRKLGSNFKTVQREEPAILKDSSLGTHKTVNANGIDFHCVVKGEGPLMLFLHGFPEFWFSWRHQMAEFSKTHTCVAVDLRGYNTTTKPTKTSDYTMQKLSQDVVELVKALGSQKCILVAHDWGAAVAWHVAINNPEVIDKLIIMNVPHPAAMKKNMTFKQFLRSWYIFFFQVPYFPEIMIKNGDYHMLTTAFKSSGLSHEEIDAFKYALSRPGAVTSAINYYRCLPYNLSVKPKSSKVTVPTLVIWGEDDVALGKELNNGLNHYVPDLKLIFVKNATHWVNQHRPQEVNQHMREYLK